MTDAEFLAWLDAGMGRLGARDDEVVGVPMVVALDTGGEPIGGDDPLGRDFARAVRLMEAEGRTVGGPEIALVLEVLAEREVAG